MTSIRSKKGITLLLVILVLSALMTISIGIFNIVFNELQVSGDMKGSFDALYSADTMLEYAFYLDRVETGKTGPGGSHTFIACTYGIANCSNWGGQNWNKVVIDQSTGFGQNVLLQNGSCGVVTIDKTSNTAVVTTGENHCNTNTRMVLRSFQAIY